MFFVLLCPQVLKFVIARLQKPEGTGFYVILFEKDLGVDFQARCPGTFLQFIFFSSGVDVIITIFCYFCQFSAKKWRFSQKPML
jgi:hypothetical protein